VSYVPGTADNSLPRNSSRVIRVSGIPCRGVPLHNCRRRAVLFCIIAKLSTGLGAHYSSLRKGRWPATIVWNTAAVLCVVVRVGGLRANLDCHWRKCRDRFRRSPVCRFARPLQTTDAQRNRPRRLLRRPIHSVKRWSRTGSIFAKLYCPSCAFGLGPLFQVVFAFGRVHMSSRRPDFSVSARVQNPLLHPDGSACAQDCSDWLPANRASRSNSQSKPGTL
jgi:hypothetical protein